MNETYIKEFILDGDFLDQESIEKIEEKMFSENLSFIDSIIELELLEQEILDKIMNLLNGVPKTKLKNKAINIDTFLLIPEPIARTKKIIPFENNEKTVSVAVPNTNISYDFIREIIPKDYELEVFLADEEDINRKISDYQKLLKEGLVSGIINNLGKISKVEYFGYKNEKDLPEGYLSDIANDYYAEKFLRELLEYAKTSDASHIYITDGEKENLISFRMQGVNYSVMEIEKNTVFAIATRLKQLADINIFEEKEIIKEASFRAELNSEISTVFLSFVKTVFGNSITLELAQDKKIGSDFLTSSSRQREILYKNLEDHKGFYIISGEPKSGKTKTTYSVLENEVEKNKEIYSLENSILHRIDFVNQILIDKKTKKEILLSKIIQNRPDVISIDYIKPFILKTLFNYVGFGGKVVLGIKNDISTFIDTLLDFDLDKGRIVRNFNLFIEHKKFQKLENDGKKVFLKKEDLSILTRFISKKEILELFQEEKLITEKIKKVEKIEFYTKDKKSKKSDEVYYIRGILDLGLNLENSFLKKYTNEKVKFSLKNDVKRSVLENALILSHQGKIDIKEVLKYLTKA